MVALAVSEVVVVRQDLFEELMQRYPSVHDTVHREAENRRLHDALRRES